MPVSSGRLHPMAALWRSAPDALDRWMAGGGQSLCAQYGVEYLGGLPLDIRIIEPRLEEIFEMIKGRLEKSGFHESAGRRIVLTGGASQLIGVRELAGRVLLGYPAIKMDSHIEIQKALRRLPRLAARVAELERMLAAGTGSDV